MEIIRKIIFYIFFAAYLVLCPLLILYSFGYIVYPFREELVHTGVIHLSTSPSGAQVFLEKARFKERTPSTIRDLLPGKYSVRLELKGHHPWVHKVLVEDGKASAFDKILLIPKDWKPKEIYAGSFDDLAPLAGANYFILSKGDQLQEYYIYDRKKGNAWPFLSSNPELEGSRVSTVFSREEGESVLTLGGALWDRKYLYAQVTGQGMKIRDISNLITERPVNITWDADRHDIIFALYEEHIDRLDTLSAALYPKYIEGIRGWGIDRGQIYVIDENNNVLVSPVSKKDFKIVSENSELADIFAKEKDFYEIRPFNNDTFAFLGSRSAVILNRTEPYLVDAAVIGVSRDPVRNQLLVWTRKAIGIFDLSEEDEPSSSTESSTRFHWMFTRGKDIRQCFWVHEGSHVVFRDGNNILLLEPEPQGEAHVEPVTASKENSSIMYVEAQGLLYFLGEEDGDLYALDLVPKQNAEPLSFVHDTVIKKEGP